LEVISEAMPEPVYSIVFDRSEALKAYPQIGKSDLVLGVLASIPPEADWEGCLVYEGRSPMEETRTVCIGIRGVGADEVQERLVEGFELKGIPILQVYEGGPEVREVYARAEGQTWKGAE
jgi:hypothetical protein